MDGRGEAILVHADYSAVSSAKPAEAGEVVILYATGLGAVTPAIAAGVRGGNGAELGPFNVVSDTVQVSIDGKPATVQWAGLAPGWAALYQVNVVVPVSVGAGSMGIVVSAGTLSSQAGVTLPCGSSDWAPLTSGMIGPSGGSLSASGVRLDIASGALAQSANLSVSAYRRTVDPNPITPVFGLKGLPGPTNAPITVTVDLAHTPADPDSVYLYAESAGVDGGAQWFKASVQGNRMTATLPAMTVLPKASAAGAVRLAASPLAGLDIDLGYMLLWGIELRTGVWDTPSLEFWFPRYASLSDAQTKELTDYMEQSLHLLEGYGFDWKPRIRPGTPSTSQNPAKIVVSFARSPSHDPNHPGRVQRSLDGKQPIYVWMTFDDDTLKTDAGRLRFAQQASHMLFHLMQDLYHPVPANLLTFEQRRNWYAMDEATATAFEVFVLGGDPAYAAAFSLQSRLAYITEGLAAPDLAKIADPVRARNALAEQGRYSALFLGYLMGDEPKSRAPREILYKLYQRRAASTTGSGMLLPVEALQAERSSLASDWLDYCHTRPWKDTAAMMDVASLRQYQIASGSAIKRYAPSLHDLSAFPYVFGLEGTFPAGSKIAFTVTSAAPVAVDIDALDTMHQWKREVGTAGQRVEVPADQLGGEYLVVTVVNQRAVRPFDADTAVELTVEMVYSEPGLITQLKQKSQQNKLLISMGIFGNLLCDYPRGCEGWSLNAESQLGSDIPAQSKPNPVTWNGLAFSSSAKGVSASCTDRTQNLQGAFDSSGTKVLWVEVSDVCINKRSTSTTTTTTTLRFENLPFIGSCGTDTRGGAQECRFEVSGAGRNANAPKVTRTVNESSTGVTQTIRGADFTYTGTLIQLIFYSIF